MSKSSRMTARTAVVTGGAHGIGRAAAQCLAEEGVTVAIIDRESEAADNTAAEIRASGGKVHAFAADCTDEAAVISTFSEIVRAIGDIDILLNNVGGSAKENSREFFEQNSAIWRQVVDQCLIATMTCSRQVVQGMRGRKYGKIINIASDSALIGDIGQTEYAAAKMGVIGFTRALARELAPYSVNVNAVCPGVTKTRALERLRPEILRAAEEKIPMGRSARPEEIGKAIAFLASSDSDYITGQSLLVDGGRWMV